MTGDAPRSSTFGERDVLKLMYAALIRAWRGLTEPPKPRGGRRGAGGGEEQAIGSLVVITTHAPLAGKVQRKVLSGVAQLAATGSPLDWPKIAPTPAVWATTQRSRLSSSH